MSTDGAELPPTPKAQRLTRPAVAPPKQKKPKSPGKRPVTTAGVTDRNPFFPFAEAILRGHVRPLLDRLMVQATQAGTPITSREQLLRAYRKTVGSRVSMTTFSAWLNDLGYRTQTVFGAATPVPIAVPQPPQPQRFAEPAVQRPEPEDSATPHMVAALMGDVEDPETDGQFANLVS